LPFCRVHCRGRRPPNPAHPKGFRTLGDHLRKRRLDLGLTQTEAGRRSGAAESTLYTWELGNAAPALLFYPAILALLGYDPLPVPASVREQLRLYRQWNGFSLKTLARQMGIDAGRLARRERGRRQPTGRFLTVVERVVGRLAPGS